MASKRHTSLAVVMFGALAAGVACGTTVAAEGAGDATVSAQRVVQDPDNPAARNYAGPAAAPANPSVIRDPDNPYFTHALETTGDVRTSLVRDPENPNWSGFNGAGVGSSSGSLGLR